MKYRLAATGLNWIAKRLDGHKTRIGAGIKIFSAILMGANEFLAMLHAMFPEVGPPGVTREMAAAISGTIFVTGSGLQGIGTAHKFEKETELIKHTLGEGHSYDGA